MSTEKTSLAESRQAEVADLRRQTASLSAPELVAWIWKRFGDRVALASSLGVEDQLLTHWVCTQVNAPRLFTLDTGRLPEETYDVLEATRQRYGVDIEVFFPDAAAVEQMVAEHGPNLFRRSVALRKRCCQVRKIEPLRRALAGLDAWVCGLRSEQSVTRANLERIEFDEQFGLIKVAPLADWTTEQVWQQVRQHDIPTNRLHDAGYPSIGCAPCTRAVPEGQDLRAGRWWWEAPEHKECGLHLRPDGTLGPRPA